MKTIFKFELTLGINHVLIPRGSKLLTVQMQHGKPMLWVLRDTDAQSIGHVILLVGTGHFLPEDIGDYIATVQDGDFVWHAFEESK